MKLVVISEEDTGDTEFNGIKLITIGLLPLNW